MTATMTNTATMTPTDRVRAAIARTPADYLARCCAQRAGESHERLGSYLPGLDAAGVRSLLLGLKWRPYSHPAVQAPAVAFAAKMPLMGKIGIMHVRFLPDDQPVRLVDPKGTGRVEGSTKIMSGGMSTDLLVVLLGPADDGAEIVWTFHPGDPVRPSNLPAEGNVGRTVTASEAEELGLEWIKIERD